MARELPLTRGLVTLVDEADFDWLSRWSWHAHFSKGGVYARRSVTAGGPRKIQMHRAIMAPPDGSFVDHINRNTLDNRRSNLRIASLFQNAQNISRRKNVSGYRGVYQMRDEWTVLLHSCGTRYYGGQFSDLILAARRYDELAREHHGEFAVLNFPDEAEAA